MTADAGRLLIVDDEESFGRALARQFEAQGFAVWVKTDGADALLEYETIAPDVVIVDLAMPGLDGLQVLAGIRRQDTAASVIILSGAVDVRTTVRALRAGAEDVQTKPPEFSVLHAAAIRAVQRSRSLRTHRAANTQISDPYGFFDDSPAMRRVVRLVEHHAQSTPPVLIVGEAGTGKQVVAEMLHQLSSRAGRPFVRVPCGRLDERGLEAVLVGSTAKAGGRSLLEQAAGGTLFFDGVTVMTAACQSLLHDVFAGRTGGAEGMPRDMRLVFSTSRDLSGDVESGALRADLFQRMSVLTIAIPALRSRSEDDFARLAARMMQAQRFALGRGPLRLDEASLELLRQADWPGNVRQLHHVLEEACVAALDCEVLEPMHLRGVLAREGLEDVGVSTDSPDYSLEAMERLHIARVLAASRGRRTTAAKLLGITRSTLYKKLAEYGLD